jgi:acetyltransferase-like isoleucine patch superfamily enzyme
MIHKSANVQTATIGEGTVVWQFSVVLPGAEIGANCNINCHVFIENDVVIGDNVTVKSGVQVWDGITLEDDVFVGPNATFTNDPSPRSKQHLDSFSRTIVREGASIGANATLLPGLEIGHHAMIGAGSVLTKNAPPHTVWFGNPAQHRGYVTEDSILLGLDLTDEDGNSYMLEKDIPVRQ